MTTAPNPHTIDIEDVRCATCDEPAHYERQHRWAVKVCDRCRQTEDECECRQGGRVSTSTFNIKPARTALYCDGCGRPQASGDAVVIKGEWSDPSPRLVVCLNCVDGLIDALTDGVPMPKQEVQP